MTRFKPYRLVLRIAFCFLAVFLGAANAQPLCDTSALGLQSDARIPTGVGGCVLGGGSSPAINEVSSARAHAFASTSYGINSASVSGNLTSEGGTTNASAWSIWADTITITNGTGTGTVTFGTHVSGSFTNHTTSHFHLAVNEGAGGNAAGSAVYSGEAYNPGGISSISDEVVLNYIFTYDVPFHLRSWLQVSGNLNSRECCGETSFFADFSNTAILATVVFPSGAVLVSESGSIYPAVVPTIPEPETYAMLLAGLGLVGFLARRRKLKHG